MQSIIQDAADSADNFIAGPGNEVSALPNKQQVVENYLARLTTYKTVLMGRASLIDKLQAYRQREVS